MGETPTPRLLAVESRGSTTEWPTFGKRSSLIQLSRGHQQESWILEGAHVAGANLGVSRGTVSFPKEGSTFKRSDLVSQSFAEWFRAHWPSKAERNGN